MVRDGHYYERVGQKYKTKRDRMGQSGRGRNLGGYKGAAGGQGWCGLESGSMEDVSGAPDPVSFGSGPGLMRWLWHCAKRVHDAGQHGARHWELGEVVSGEDCVLSGERLG